MPGVPIDINPQMAAAFQGQMHRFDLLHAERERQARSSAPPTSQLAIDMRDRSFRHVYDTATFHVLAAIDHLHAVRLLLDGGGVPSHAVMSMFRVALETSLAGYWTVEPEDPDERRLRGFASAWADLVERGKVEALGGDPLDAHLTPETLLDEAEPFGVVLPKEQAANGKPVPRRLCLKAPPSVRLAQLYPQADGCEFLYRYLSGFSHGKLWALLSTLHTDKAHNLDHDMAAVPAAVPDEYIVVAAMFAVDALAMVVGRLGALNEPLTAYHGDGGTALGDRPSS